MKLNKQYYQSIIDNLAKALKSNRNKLSQELVSYMETQERYTIGFETNNTFIEIDFKNKKEAK